MRPAAACSLGAASPLKNRPPIRPLAAGPIDSPTDAPAAADEVHLFVGAGSLYSIQNTPTLLRPGHAMAIAAPAAGPPAGGLARKLFDD